MTGSHIVVTISAHYFANAEAYEEADLPNVVLSREGELALESLVAVIDALHLGSPGGRQYSICLAYTMCDEYGVVLRDRTRSIETPEQWRAFIALSESLQEGSGVAHDEAWGRFVGSIQEGSGRSKDLVRLRRLLLNGTRGLWMALARDFKSERALVNGYLVQAKPLLEAMPDRRKWAVSGCLQVFADIFLEESR